MAFCIDGHSIGKAIAIPEDDQGATIADVTGLGVKVIAVDRALLEIGEIHPAVIRAPTKPVGKHHALVNGVCIAVAVKPEQPADRAFPVPGHGSGPEPALAIDFAVVEVHIIADIGIAQIGDGLDGPIYRRKTTLQPRYKAAAAAQPHGVDRFRYGLDVICPGARVKAIDRGLEDVQPVQHALLRRPHRSFAQDRRDVQRHLDRQPAHGPLPCGLLSTDRSALASGWPLSLGAQVFSRSTSAETPPAMPLGHSITNSTSAAPMPMAR